MTRAFADDKHDMNMSKTVVEIKKKPIVSKKKPVVKKEETPKKESVLKKPLLAVKDKKFEK